MAEAHQAVAFSINLTRQGLSVYVDTELLSDIFHGFARYSKLRFLKFRNNVSNSLYPLNVWSFTIFWFVACFLMINPIRKTDPTWGVANWVANRLPEPESWVATVETILVFVFYTVVWLVFVSSVRLILWLFLLNKRPLFERGKRSMLSQITLVVLNTVIKLRKPALYSFQGIIPKLPLPSLDDTIRRWLVSVRELYPADKMAVMEKLAEEFRTNEGRHFQRYLWLKWLLSANYVSDWWERFVYLRSRSPILVNSNFYAIDALFQDSTNRQASRAANLTTAMLRYRDVLHTGNQKPLVVAGSAPLCSYQYDRQFDTTRVPGIEEDKLVHKEMSHHVAVYHLGRWFRLNTYHKNVLLEPAELEAQYEAIIGDSSSPAYGEDKMCALTGGDRDAWGRVRQDYFLANAVNRASLDVIEGAAFVVVLDDAEHSYKNGSQESLDSFTNWLLCGDGTNRWCDKSFNLIVMKNGFIGANVEHSWADAPITSQMMEWVLHEDLAIFGYLENGRCKGEKRFNLQPPKRLKFVFDDVCVEAIDKSLTVCRSIVEDVDLAILHFVDYGKGFMKKQKVSPDAYIQMALQLSYFRDIGRFDLTYEASMTRLYLEGRTETVRPLTTQSANFVRSMEDREANNADRAKLLKIACDQHQTNYLECMAGNGIDRHLFTLFVVSKYTDRKSEFLEEIMKEAWKLSTSQTPLSQLGLFDITKYPNFVSAGGGFGPVSDNGYGVSYIVSGEGTIFFHISSKRSATHTDSKRFRKGLYQALMDMRAIFD